MRVYEKREYITEQAYGDHPVGSKVLATKDYLGVLLLEFEDGSNVKILNGWCRGIEEPPAIYISFAEAIAREIDAQVLAEIEAAVKERKNRR
jgi:hypothetical protein